MATVNAAVRAQNGNVLPLLTDRVTLSTDDEHIMLDDDGTITGVTVTKKDAEIKASSDDAGFTAMFTVKVSNPVATIALNPDDSSISLAADEMYSVTATAKDEDKEDTSPLSGSDWTWTSDDPSVATVDKGSMGTGDDKKTVHNVGIITGKSTGVATITVETEGGVMASIEVTVTGQTITRRLNASTSSNGNNLKFDKNSGAAVSTEFNVNLYDIISNDRIDEWTLTIEKRDDGADLVLVTGHDSSEATKTVMITTNVGSEAVGIYPAIVVLKSTGAKELRLRFTVEVIDSSTP